MRMLVALTLTSCLAACSFGPPPPTGPDPQAEARLAAMLAGKVAGPPQNCIPLWETRDMQVIDSRTIAYRSGSTVYVNPLRGDCSGIGVSSVLVMRPIGFSGYCENDVAEVMDSASGMMMGSCVLGPFIPYTSPAQRR